MASPERQCRLGEGRSDQVRDADALGIRLKAGQGEVSRPNWTFRFSADRRCACLRRRSGLFFNGTNDDPSRSFGGGRRGPLMCRFGVIALAALLAAGLPTHAIGQTAPGGFEGLAAYYAAPGNGLTAAHRTLPFGTRLRVTDPKTGRSVIVTINDRGPFGRRRVIDLSLSAARALGMVDRGVIFVRADVL